MAPSASDGWNLQLIVAITGAGQRAGVLARLCPFPSYGNTNSHIESSCLLRYHIFTEHGPRTAPSQSSELFIVNMSNPDRL